MLNLSWPTELSSTIDASVFQWTDNNANIVLDFHGNPNKAVLTVFSDGNHHMALAESLQAFSKQYLQDKSIFYLTLPPAVLAQIIKHPAIMLGNMELNLKPDVIIGPGDFVNQYHSQLSFSTPVQFAYSLGNSFLFRKQLPVKLNSVTALLNSDLRLFLSNPHNEKASYQVYRQTLENLAQQESLPKQQITNWLDNNNPRLIFGQRVHHREAPESLYRQQADIALLYHHLALRYTRIFPDAFALSRFYGSGTHEVSTAQVSTNYSISAADQAHATALQQFFISTEVSRIYESHGLGSACKSD